jgi:hypothetical protein
MNLMEWLFGPEDTDEKTNPLGENEDTDEDDEDTDEDDDDDEDDGA